MGGVSHHRGRRLLREFFLPLVKEQVELVHSYGKLFHYYDGGKMMQVLPMLAEAGVDVASTVAPPPLGDVDLAKAKADVGDRLCLAGYVDAINVIKDGMVGEIRDTVRQAILDAAPGGGYILGTSDSIRDASADKVRAYMQAGRDFGTYARLGHPLERVRTVGPRHRATHRPAKGWCVPPLPPA